MSGREEEDFMNINSFAKLPFIRSPQIRLFGFDYPPHSSDRHTAVTAVTAAAPNDGGKKKKFECQYCFRNFPTSQALGGHQNAHKRERREAKSAFVGERYSNSNNSGRRPPPHYPCWSFSDGTAAGGVVGPWSKSLSSSLEVAWQRKRDGRDGKDGVICLDLHL